MWISASHFVRNLRGFVTGKRRRDFVVRYPEELMDFPDAFRGMPVLVALSDGRPLCVACGLCAYACPTRCISIAPGETADAGNERYAESFEIDMGRCMFCGLCEEACPEEAIVMSPHVEIAAFDRASLVFDKKQLLVPAAALSPRLEFLRRARAAGDESNGTSGAASKDEA